jgi:hypothetical protein
MNMKIAGLVAVIALLAGPAWAQTQPHVQGPGEPDKDKTAAEIANEKEAERAYKRSLGNIQEQKTADPGNGAQRQRDPKAGARPHRQAENPEDCRKARDVG